MSPVSSSLDPGSLLAPGSSLAPGASPYQGYLYAYPHKTAYRPLNPRPTLREIWADQPSDSLVLYLHLPFCEMRCGFCNLFTRANPPQDQVDAYLRQLRAQAEVVRAALPGARFVAAAVGGGTPTFLSASQLAELCDIIEPLLGKDSGVGLAVETSPGTATPDRLAVLAANGATRVSMGVQSFLDTEAHAAGRPQRRSEVDRALGAIREARIANLNIDLIYGIDGQTADSWRYSLGCALDWQPEELYLYPLYVRPLTGLGRRNGSTVDDSDPRWDADRMALYRQGRDTLRAAGYRQVSMRQFRRMSAEQPSIEYSCQDDGMVGLGCGSRSYTATLHYSFDYAVSVRGVRQVIADYLSREPEDFAYADVGYRLDPAEQRRRWLLMSLLQADGASPVAYHRRFATSIRDDFPQLDVLAARGWLAESDRPAEGGSLSESGSLAVGGSFAESDSVVALTDEGLAHSDAIGPWLISATVRAAMGKYALR